MMASNLLSKLLPSASDDPSEVGDLGHGTRRSSGSSNQHEMDIDEENLEARFEAQDLENLLADASDSHMTTESTPFIPSTAHRKPDSHRSTAAPRAPAWGDPASARAAPMYDDDDVPESLLLEGVSNVHPTQPGRHRGPVEGLPPPVPGPSTRQARAQWETTRRHQRLHDENRGAPPPGWAVLSGQGHIMMDPKERAHWRWVNISDMDTFLAEVYTYFQGCGIYSILLRRFLALLQTVFVVAFITFLSWCIDYPRLSKSHKMSEVLIPKCTKKMHGMWIFALWCFIMYSLYSFARLVLDIPQLKAMHDFYHYLLDIPDRDIQTVQWQQIVARIMALRDLNARTASNLSPAVRKLLNHESRQRLDAVDIASRLMRQDNYLIALFNKEILDVTIPIPFLGNRYIFSETTKWHVRLAIMDFVFSGPNNTFNQDFLKVANRRDLVKKLQNRFFWVGVISIIYAPFTVTFVLASYLFKYFTEYHKDPSQLGTRDFTPFAQWKFREFNELPHLFTRRKNMAYPYANAYIAQFPKDKTEQISAFVAFVVGAFAFVLFSITLLDSELFLNFEITPGKTALFWIGIFTAIYRVARSSSPQEDHVPDPEYYLRHVNYHTHYEPPSWQDRLHTDEVRQEFSQLYQPKVLIFAEEVLSMVITPFLLIFRLPGCSDRIVDFFREFSIVVDGLGVVCSYSMFGFQKGVQKPPSSVLRAPPGADAGGRGVSREGPDLREDYFNTRDDKMVKSYYGFLDAYNMDGKGKSQGKGNFHPPPQFPNTFGAMSQTGALPGEMSIRGTSRDLLGRHPHSRRRDDPAINSILLDPHHQPSASALRNSPRQAPHGRYRSHLHPPSELPGISSRNSRIEEESTLGDSWRTGRPGEEEEEEDEADTRGGNRGGVLQLLRQFSQAQTEGRAVGI